MIVDDVSYFAEPFFMDGMIAQAVDIVAARGVAYFSSAGNQARHSYENEFRGINVLVNAGKNLNGGKAVVRRFHDFGTAQEPAILQPVFLQPDCGGRVHDLQLPVGSAASDGDDLRADEGRPGPVARGRRRRAISTSCSSTTRVTSIRHCPPGVSRGITCQITGDRNIGGDAVDVAALFYSGPPKTSAALLRRLRRERRARPGRREVRLVRQPGHLRRARLRHAERHRVRSRERSGHQAIGAASWYVTVPFSTSGLVPPNDTQTPAIDLSPCAPAA